MFRRFKQVKYQNSKEPENIIIYVGDKHAKTYRKMLKQLSFKEEFKSKSKSGEFCIDITDLDLPLFY